MLGKSLRVHSHIAKYSLNGEKWSIHNVFSAGGDSADLGAIIHPLACLYNRPTDRPIVVIL